MKCSVAQCATKHHKVCDCNCSLKCETKNDNNLDDKKKKLLQLHQQTVVVDKENEFNVAKTMNPGEPLTALKKRKTDV